MCIQICTTTSLGCVKLFIVQWYNSFLYCADQFCIKRLVFVSQLQLPVSAGCMYTNDYAIHNVLTPCDIILGDTHLPEIAVKITKCALDFSHFLLHINLYIHLCTFCMQFVLLKCVCSKIPLKHF